MIYFLIFVFLLILAGTDMISYPQAIKILIFYLIGCSLVLFSGLRFETGFDYENYKNIFYDIKVFKDATQSLAVEPGMGILIYSLKACGIPYGGLLLLIAVIAIFLKFRFIEKYSIYPFFSVLIYYSRVFLAQDMGQMRQGLAMAIILFSMDSILNKNFKRFLFIIVLACLFHLSAILFFPIYFIANRKFSKKTISAVILLATVFAVFFDFKSILMNYAIGFLPGFLSNKLLLYASVMEADQTLGLTFSVFFRIFLVLVLVWMKDRVTDLPGYTNAVFNIYVFGLIFYLVLNSFPQMGGRGSLYFQQFEILLIPIMIKCLKETVFKVMAILIIGLYCFWGMNTIVNSPEDAYIPYKTVIS
jgi:hypothetical protein